MQFLRGYAIVLPNISPVSMSHSPPVGLGFFEVRTRGSFLGVVILRKAAFFIDGFNLYHSLDNRTSLRKYKWLNLWKFSESLMLPNETLSDVHYFTAYTDWNPARKLRHQVYVKINKSVGCKVTLGKFLTKDRTSMVMCNTPCAGGLQQFCKKKYIAHEEKMTDVNIAVGIVKAAATNAYDSIYLISGDNDLLPALETAKEISPTLNIRVVLPINAQAKNLMTFCAAHGLKYIRIKENKLAAAQFSDPVIISGVSYSKPSHWI